MSERKVRSHLIAPDRSSAEADVENGYRLFLGREPEARTAVVETAGHPLTSVIVSFLVSCEFKDKLGLIDGMLAVNEVMLLQLDRDLRDWVASITQPDFVPDDEPMNRLTVIRTILHDDRILDALGAVGSFDIGEIAALDAAFAQLDEMVRLVDASVLFDSSYYESTLSVDTRIADLATHYVLYGERAGLKPSPAFDAAMYADLNADVAASGFNRLAHYEMRGRQEGRVHRDWLIDHAFPALQASEGRPTVLLLLHEATYTGAPILGWNLVRALSDQCNIVVVLRRGGALETALREVASVVVAAPPYEATLDPYQMGRFAERLAAVYRPLYAIANSVESRSLATPLRRYYIPIVALIHEFWPGAKPGVRLDFYADCAALVFPARLVEQSSFHAFRETALQNRFILPQGPCAIPRFEQAFAPLPVGAPFSSDDTGSASLGALMADGQRGAGPFTVIGLGAVEMRKGLDLFMSAATALRAKHPDIAFRFIWIGTWEHAIGSPYAALLEEQYQRCDLGDRLHFFPAVDDLEPIYARADALFLSSRLDPLPNITIDAALRGIPVVCFDRASGAAELLTADSDTAALVVPHLDSGAAADVIAKLASDSEFRAASGEAMQRLARRTFDMEAYARALNEIGHEAARKFGNTDQDLRLIDRADAFDAPVYFCPHPGDIPAGKTPAAVYLDQIRHINFAAPPVFGVILRRPKIGFHPFIYGTESPDFPRDGSRDPLAHYVECGMPTGRWAHRVLRLDLTEPAGEPTHVAPSDHAAGTPRVSGIPAPAVALHGHFHYPDNIGDLVVALAANRLRADLFLTTTNTESAEILRAATSEYRRGDVTIEVGPNVGRDIYSFLRVLRTHIQGRYELVGHIHGKRSVHTQDFDPDYGDRWRRFLWEHLLGPAHCAADVIVDAMRRDSRLGLVFPEDGFLTGWEKNDSSAAALARRVGLRMDLPSYIEFPAGTMFWARVEALDALIRADLRAEEMPAEPVPIDGTVLHALERMLPLLCEEAGYTYATSYTPKIRR